MNKKLVRIFTLMLAGVMALSMAACGEKEDAATTAADADTTAAVDVTAEPEIDTDTQIVDDTTAALVDDTTAEAVEATEAAATTAAPETTTETTTAAPETTATTTTTTTTTTTEAAAKAPTDKAEILKLYNDATAKVASKKPAFSKRRETKEGVYDAGLALRPFKDLVYKFMGIGSSNVYAQNVAKNDGDYGHYFLASKLTASDITGATCTLGSDGTYTVTINVKDGTSHVSGTSESTKNAPIDKSGISAGEGDKNYWDHKSAQNVYAAIKDVASGAVIDEKYSGAVVKATIDKDGNLKTLDVSFNITFDIAKVYGASGHATGSTAVSFSGFKW